MLPSSEFRTGRHVVFSLTAHLVFVPKYRKRVISQRVFEVLREAWETVCADFECELKEAGFGCGDPSAIAMAGDDVSGVDFHFRVADTFASRGQKLIYHGPLKFAEKLLLRTFLAPWSYVASRLYHDVYWYPFIGRRRVRAALQTEWGKLFERY